MPPNRHEPLYAKTIGEVRDLSDEDLVAQRDALIEIGGFVAAPKYYIEELARRREQKAARTMIWLTAVITVLTVVNVIAVIATL
jgi:hypothetical protein